MSRGRRRRRRQTAVSPYEGRSNWMSHSGWLFLGLIIGLAVGLYYSWVISPVVFTDASPARLGEPYKSGYVELISQSYISTGDWELAQARLATLEDPDIGNTVATMLETAIRDQRSDKTIRGLAALAQNLGVQDRTVALFAPTPATAVPTATDTPDPVITPTVTPTIEPTETAVPTIVPSATVALAPTAQPNYRLLEQEQICGADSPQIAVNVLDALLNPQPGVEVVVNWTNGRDHFFTGFKPENGLGYGDFTMSPDVSYSVFLAEGSPEISGLRIETCEDGSQAGWLLTFQNLRLSQSEE